MSKHHYSFLYYFVVGSGRLSEMFRRLANAEFTLFARGVLSPCASLSIGELVLNDLSYKDLGQVRRGQNLCGRRGSLLLSVLFSIQYILSSVFRDYFEQFKSEILAAYSGLFMEESVCANLSCRVLTGGRNKLFAANFLSDFTDLRLETKNLQIHKI
ncbi:MAG: hypothetical protein LBB88_08120 [Planctomycetaceae bacterium]|nr:hypothetical protein [Planctomycetaceae bacterium]